MKLPRDYFLSFFPERRLFFITLCIGGILGFYLLSILPHQQAADQLESQIEDLRSRIDAQKLLGPIYHRFTQMVAETRPAMLKGLPYPPAERLTAEQVAGIESLFHQLAAQGQLEIRRIGADLNAMINETGELKLSLEIRGAFDNLRGFMLKLAELPFLTHIDRIEIRREGGMPDLHMELDLWLARQ